MYMYPSNFTARGSSPSVTESTLGNAMGGGGEGQSCGLLSGGAAHSVELPLPDKLP